MAKENFQTLIAEPPGGAAGHSFTLHPYYVLPITTQNIERIEAVVAEIWPTKIFKPLLLSHQGAQQVTPTMYCLSLCEISSKSIQ